jgi:hypothetical protein
MLSTIENLEERASFFKLGIGDPKIFFDFIGEKHFKNTENPIFFSFYAVWD